MTHLAGALQWLCVVCRQLPEVRKGQNHEGNSEEKPEVGLSWMGMEYIDGMDIMCILDFSWGCRRAGWGTYGVELSLPGKTNATLSPPPN